MELLRFYQLLAGLEPEMVPPPSPERLARCVPLVGEKDVHVLTAALACGAAYLLTLDRHHLMTPAVQSAGLSVRVVTPGDFLKGACGRRLTIGFPGLHNDRQGIEASLPHFGQPHPLHRMVGASPAARLTCSWD